MLNNKIFIAREWLEFPRFVVNTGRKLSSLLNCSESCLSHCIIDGMRCRGYEVEVLDMSTDLKPNTKEDYIEYCKFEKINPRNKSSYVSYQESLQKEKEIEESLSM